MRSCRAQVPAARLKACTTIQFSKTGPRLTPPLDGHQQRARTFKLSPTFPTVNRTPDSGPRELSTISSDATLRHRLQRDALLQPPTIRMGRFSDARPHDDQNSRRLQDGAGGFAKKLLHRLVAPGVSSPRGGYSGQLAAKLARAFIRAHHAARLANSGGIVKPARSRFASGGTKEMSPRLYSPAKYSRPASSLSR